jgi:hypothetical protein
MVPGAVTANEAPSPYLEVATHYEAIRLVLLSDSVEGVEEHAKAIEDLARELLGDFDAASSSVPDEDIATFKAALEEIQSAASDLSAADGLAPAREHFFALTKPMARYRKLSGDQTSIVAYCSMAQKAWIQPEGEIGNPYMGQQMPRCGEVVGG